MIGAVSASYGATLELRSEAANMLSNLLKKSQDARTGTGVTEQR